MPEVKREGERHKVKLIIVPITQAIEELRHYTKDSLFLAAGLARCTGICRFGDRTFSISSRSQRFCWIIFDTLVPVQVSFETRRLEREGMHLVYQDRVQQLRMALRQGQQHVRVAHHHAGGEVVLAT